MRHTFIFILSLLSFSLLHVVQFSAIFFSAMPNNSLLQKITTSTKDRNCLCLVCTDV